MTGFHVQRLKPQGPVTQHYDGPAETDGPFLLVWPIEGKAAGGAPALIVPSHALIDVTPCDGSCLTTASYDASPPPDGSTRHGDQVGDGRGMAGG